MRIIYLHQYFNTLQMFGGTRSFEMARRLVAWGHEVHMITTIREKYISRKWSRTIEEGIKVHWLSVPYDNSMYFIDRIRAFLKYAIESAIYGCHLSGDVIFATSTPLTVALPAAYISKRKKIPLIFEVRDLWPELPIAIGTLKGPMIPPAVWLEKFAYRNSKEIIALSPGMKEGIIRTGFPTERIHVIPNSADLEMFNVPEITGHEFRKQFNWLGNRPLVVYAGALGRINGVGYLADLASAVMTKNPDICFLVVGEGAENDKVLSIAKTNGVFERNFFMLPAIPKQKMPAVLSAADIATSLFIDLPPMWANSANKFFDALASGTPVAINYLGWQADLISGTGVGVVLDRKDFEKSSHQIIDAIEDREQLKVAGIAARELAQSRFSRDKLAKKLETVLISAAD